VRVLLTGGSGRLGPYVIRDLLAGGHDITLFSRRPVSEFPQLPWVEGDIASSADCERALASGFDAVQHLAAQPTPSDHPRMPGVRENGVPFDATMMSNIMGTYYLLHAAQQAGVGTFVMTGSICALGSGFQISETPFPLAYLPVDEAHPSAVEDSYSYSKLAGEELLASYSRAYGMRTHVVRAAGIYNEDRRKQYAASVGPAGGWNPWLWVWCASEDVASAHRLLMEQAADIPSHGVYFCTADDSTALEPTRELVERFRPELSPVIRELAGTEALLSNRKLRETVGWQHRMSWRQWLPTA
jgi:nucleoside-diphosphate-sugar epimerase